MFSFSLLRKFSSNIPVMAQTIYKPVTHVIYDLDGLLLETETVYFKAINSLAEKYGKKYTLEAKVKAMGKVGREAGQTAIDEIGLPITVDQYLDELAPIFDKVLQNIDFMPGALRLIKHLHKHNIPQAIATSSGRRNFETKIKCHGDIFKEGNYFHHILVASDDPDIQFGKPHPQTFLVCARRFQPPASPDKTLVFEDSPNGVKAALAAGMQCVQVPDPQILKFNDVTPTIMIDSLENFQPELFALPPF